MAMCTISYRYDGAMTAKFVNRSSAKKEVMSLLSDPNVTKLVWTYRTVTVSFGGAKRYTYLSEEDYKPGTMVRVPGCDQPVEVIYSTHMTKSELVKLAQKNGFTLADYKTIIGMNKPNEKK